MSNRDGDTADGKPDQTEALIDHVGHQLRNTLSADTEQPAYLGDPTIPAEFTATLERLKKSVELREQGVEAVRATLDALVAAPRRTR